MDVRSMQAAAIGYRERIELKLKRLQEASSCSRKCILAEATNRLKTTAMSADQVLDEMLIEAKGGRAEAWTSKENRLEG